MKTGTCRGDGLGSEMVEVPLLQFAGSAPAGPLCDGRCRRDSDSDNTDKGWPGSIHQASPIMIRKRCSPPRSSQGGCSGLCRRVGDEGAAKLGCMGAEEMQLRCNLSKDSNEAAVQPRRTGVDQCPLAADGDKREDANGRPHFSDLSSARSVEKE